MNIRTQLFLGIALSSLTGSMISAFANLKGCFVTQRMLRATRSVGVCLLPMASNLMSYGVVSQLGPLM